MFLPLSLIKFLSKVQQQFYLLKFKSSLRPPFLIRILTISELFSSPSFCHLRLILQFSLKMFKFSFMILKTKPSDLASALGKAILSLSMNFNLILWSNRAFLQCVKKGIFLSHQSNILTFVLSKVYQFFLDWRFWKKKFSFSLDH